MLQLCSQSALFSALLALASATALQITDVVAGGYHTCILTNDGRIVCWGMNFAGQLGYGHTNTLGDNENPYQASYVNTNGVPVVQLAAGFHYTCALTVNGSVLCWGLNTYGQLGYGHTNNIGDDELPSTAGYVQLPGGITVMQVVAANRHTCALAQNGSVACWGYNQEGELGLGNTNQIGDDEAPSSAGFTKLTFAVSLLGTGPAAAHTCAVTANGSAICWGRNDFGQLGYGHVNNIGDNQYPTSTAGFVNAGVLVAFASVRCGWLFTCGRYSNGSVK
jgi:alpha-tubulin suppressor-like RCC1 family protein